MAEHYLWRFISKDTKVFLRKSQSLHQGVDFLYFKFIQLLIFVPGPIYELEHSIKYPEYNTEQRERGKHDGEEEGRPVTSRK